ncbi:RNase adapter RapZ [Usitatibacter palustris]|uniref:RNase adapter protein RapZ n=1 Tax=Usitatibacter palustris TaxID=2732487 RepID=A0A6M4H3K8_9PROT|nr:RNase adapter RapZ [Usitatibacter palustris]QJR13293.1 RNase adapter protein RapZ [Usitatibacter palustris]
MHLVLLSGVSGSGKSVALKALEDAGFFCVDNLPAALIPQLVATRTEPRVAISADARSPETLAELPRVVAGVKDAGHQVQVIVLDATDESLVRRFSETRRPHPLAKDGRTLKEAIVKERLLLEGLTDIGNRIDTSALTPAQLRGWIQDLVVTDRTRLALAFVSFGFKGGVPLDADFVFDVRFLANPHYDPQLRLLTGADPDVIAFLERETEAGLLIEEIQRFLQRWIPKFVLDQRAALTVAIGCTGGRHRSVYVTNQLAERFAQDYDVIVRHRDISKA